MTPETPSPSSNLRDNHHRGTVADFLRANLRAGADLDLVTAYFTVFAYDKLRAHLDHLGKIRLLFGEAAFIKSIDPDLKQGAAYVLRDDGLTLANGLNQRHLAQACAAWMRDKVEVRSVTRTGFLHGKMAHIRRGEVSAAIVGSSNFTTRELGLAATHNNIELNIAVDSRRDGLLPTPAESARAADGDWELVTWLVMLPKAGRMAINPIPVASAHENHR